MSTEDIAILCLIVSESTREIRNDAFALENYGGENDALPSDFRPALSVKYIHNRLGISRETARRKLKTLHNLNLIHKVKGGYVFPAQLGENDYTKDIRNYLMERVKILEKHIENIPA